MSEYQKDIRKLGLGGINVDILDSLLSAEDTRTVRNARQYEGADGRDGSIRNVLGNLKISYQDENFGIGAEVIGTCRDDENDGIIFFVAANDSFWRDSIMEYYPNTGVVERVLYTSGDLVLNFSKDHRIKGAFVIDGLLYWNDANNGLRKVNLVKAKAWASGDYVNGYPSVDEQTISLIKYAPEIPLYPRYITDLTKSISNLRGILRQFCYTYTYDDGEESVSSPVSILPLPLDETDSLGNLTSTPKTNNVIVFDVQPGHHTVKAINLYVREGNDGVWQLIETINKADFDFDDDNLSYHFYNTKVLTGADQTKLNTTMHQVPLKADALGYLHTNNLLLAGLFEGYDNILPDVSLSFGLEKIELLSLDTVVKSLTFDNEQWFLGPNGYQEKGTKVYYFNTENLPAEGNVISIQLTGTHVINLLVTTLMSNDPEIWRQAVKDAINSEFSWLYEAFDEYFDPGNGLAVITNEELLILKNPFPPGAWVSGYISEYTKDESKFKPYPSFKTGATHPFGLIYWDKQRRHSFVQDCGDVYIPFPTEEAWGSGIDQEYRPYVNWEINHIPPVWAYSYQWVYAKNTNVLWFRQYEIDGIIIGDGEGDNPEVGKIGIDITSLNTLKLQNNEQGLSIINSSVEPYIWQKGDRVRFLTRQQTEEYQYLLGNLLDDYIDLEILEYQILPPDPSDDDKVLTTNILLVQEVDSSLFDYIGKRSVVEIYRPKLDRSTDLYYEMPYGGVILNPGTDDRVHSGSTRNQVLESEDDNASPARGSLYNGDVYFTPTFFNIITDTFLGQYYLFPIESLSASNIYEQAHYSLGRVHIINKEAEQKKNLNIRMSGKYFEGTEINGLSEFYGDADLFLSAEFGNIINGLQEVGFSLKVLQERKITTFFVGRTGLQLASGQDTDAIMAESDGVSTKSPAKEARGCSNYESVIAINRYLFFVDIRNGVVIRDDPNGPDDIDRYGISKDIKHICNELLANYDSNRILASHNPITNEVGFTFIGFNNGIATSFGTYYFKYDYNKWTPIFDFEGIPGSGVDILIPPCAFASINQDYISFIGTKIWQHEKNPLRNNFYGSQLPVSIETVFNKDPQFPKLYKNIEIVGKGDWSCPEEGDIKIEAKNSVSGKDQLSRLVAGKFKNIKGKKIAVLMKDMNSQNGVNKTANLVNGKDLKGSILHIKLVNTESTEAIIDSVATLYQALKLS